MLGIPYVGEILNFLHQVEPAILIISRANEENSRRVVVISTEYDAGKT